MLYGTTTRGGKAHCGEGCGTVFALNPTTGKTKDVYRFRSRADGFDPEGGLVIAHGLLYGTTLEGGTRKSGTLFSIDLSSHAKATLHDFKFPAGNAPGTLVEFDGSLFGTTHGGGASGQGTVFKYTP
jgi:uncharacterized repeat protein (TIGR03803 family)